MQETFNIHTNRQIQDGERDFGAVLGIGERRWRGYFVTRICADKNLIFTSFKKQNNLSSKGHKPHKINLITLFKKWGNQVSFGG